MASCYSLGTSSTGTGAEPGAKTPVIVEVVPSIQNTSNAETSSAFDNFSNFWTAVIIFILHTVRHKPTNLVLIDAKARHPTVCRTFLHTVQDMKVRMLFFVPTIHVTYCTYFLLRSFLPVTDKHTFLKLTNHFCISFHVQNCLYS